jgi:hypothetical protein
MAIGRVFEISGSYVTIDIVSNTVMRVAAAIATSVLFGLTSCASSRSAAPSRPGATETRRPFRAAIPSGEPRDLNEDGRPDAWVSLDETGATSQLAYDLDFDGAPDVTLTFAGGELVRKELVQRVEGVPATWSLFEAGQLVRKERDVNGDGRADAWEEWRDGVLVRFTEDVDGDGDVDREERRGEADAPRGATAAPADQK